MPVYGTVSGATGQVRVRHFTVDAAVDDPRDYPTPRPATIEAVWKIGPDCRGKYRWVVIANGRMIDLTTNQLTDGPGVGLFRNKLFEATGRLLPLRGAVWHTVLARLLVREA